MENHFDRLGLPRRFALDGAELERQYLARSRALHPDYHTTGASADLTASLELSAALNEAYNTLKDAFTRADYLLTLDGGPSATEHRQVPQAFLAEMLDLREQVEQARDERATNESSVARLAGEFTTRYDALMGEVALAFAEYETTQTDDPKRPALRQRIRTLLNAAKYVRGLIRDLNAD